MFLHLKVFVVTILFIYSFTKKRDIAINKKKEALLRDDVSLYRLEEDTLGYVLFIIRESTDKLS
jgi:hypothetical protein